MHDTCIHPCIYIPMYTYMHKYIHTYIYKQKDIFIHIFTYIPLTLIREAIPSLS